jgi:lipopolysaccharide heptosyltransferase I
VTPARGAAPRIALVKLSSLGDVVHAIPVAHALRVWWPRAQVTWVVERREQAILEGNPDLDHVVPVDTRLWRREFRRPAGAASVAVKLRGLVRQLARGRFDAAVDLQGLWKSGVITALTRAPLRLGLSATHCRERASAWFTNRRVTPPGDAVHVVDQYLAVAAAGLGMDPSVVGPPVFAIPADPGAEGAMARWLEDEGVKPGTLLTLLNPGSGGDHKRWAVEAFRRLGEELQVRLGGRVAIAWGPGEEPLARATAHGMRTGALVPPPTTIPEMIALFRRATLVVGGDTGPVHVAAVLGIPTVGLYGPTSARRNGPYGPRATAIQSPTGRMDGISVEAALGAAQALLR